MELTRRDALLAIGGMGAASAYIGTTVRGDVAELDEAEVVARLRAAEEALYPSAVEVTTEFVQAYVRGRRASREDFLVGQVEALKELDRQARHIAGRPFRSLSRERRRTVFRRLGVHRAPPVPDGTLEERVRYYVVNDLLFTLFSTPAGGRLVGCENPPGHPGGRTAYQRRPPE